MADKRYYWIKLKDTFFSSDTVDFLMSQKDGANYVVLYQMLCLKSANTGGELSRKIGEIIIPYDVEKIQRDCKYFSVDTVRIALTLYKQLGLIYEQENGVLQIANFDNLVGSEGGSAERMRRLRERASLGDGNVTKKVTTEKDNRYSINNSDTSYCSPQTPQGGKEEEKPTKAEVITYFTETLNRTESEAVSFWAWNENNGWRVGKKPMKVWQPFADIWRGSETTATSALQRTYSKDNLAEWQKDLRNFDDIEI